MVVMKEYICEEKINIYRGYRPFWFKFWINFILKVTSFNTKLRISFIEKS
jgi:hypothetical protein